MTISARTEAPLQRLARLAGISVQWEDAFKRPKIVQPDSLRAVLKALDLPAATPGEVTSSLALLEEEQAQELPPLLTADVGESIFVPLPQVSGMVRYRVTLEGGGLMEGQAEATARGIRLPAMDTPGYHSFECGGVFTTLAVAPRRCFSVADAAGTAEARLWALAVQIYSLRRTGDGAGGRAGDGGIGDFSGLSQFAVKAANEGAAGLVLSPVHAAFSSDAHHFSPYAPSSRQFLNPLHADPGVVFGGAAVDAAIAHLGLGATFETLERGEFVDWLTATPAKLAVLRHLYDVTFPQMPELAADFHAFRAAGGPALDGHARFEAIHGDRFGSDTGQWHWKTWPAGLRDPHSVEVSNFARAHAGEVTFHAFLQWVASRSLRQAQSSARAAGMSIGLISDLAVGTDGGGSQAWSRQDEMLIGLSVGAPPDLMNAIGQTWGLAAFSPRALVRTGFSVFREMLAATMGPAGGVRIDHVMGLMRLWMVPDGAAARDGAYLAYPFEDLERLVALESHRHRAIVIGEDLGTVPPGFRERLAARGILGMRVVWFEREDTHFLPAAAYVPEAAAVLTTHDLPTLAGWWCERDIDRRTPLGLLREGMTAEEEREERDRDRALLWDVISQDPAAPQPAPDDPAPVVAAALDFLGRTEAPLVVLPLEDALALPEQPNMPGTIHEHPNWRRRLPMQAADILEGAEIRGRLTLLNTARVEGHAHPPLHAAGHPSTQRKERIMPADPKTTSRATEEKELDQALEDSFPASDPPAATNPSRFTGAEVVADDRADKADTSKALDKALADSFPASDPPALATKHGAKDGDPSDVRTDAKR